MVFPILNVNSLEIPVSNAFLTLKAHATIRL
jgi:hypothetical protein